MWTKSKQIIQSKQQEWWEGKDLGIGPRSCTCHYWHIALIIFWWRRTNKKQSKLQPWLHTAWNLLHYISIHSHLWYMFFQFIVFPLHRQNHPVGWVLTSLFQSLQGLSNFPRIICRYLSTSKPMWLFSVFVFNPIVVLIKSQVKNL